MQVDAFRDTRRRTDGSARREPQCKHVADVRLTGRNVLVAAATPTTAALPADRTDGTISAALANSSTSMAGNTSKRPGATSLNWNKRHTATRVANVRPTGQTRQNTGNPNAAVDSMRAAQHPVARIAPRRRARAAGTSSGPESGRTTHRASRPSSTSKHPPQQRDRDSPRRRRRGQTAATSATTDRQPDEQGRDNRSRKQCAASDTRRAGRCAAMSADAERADGVPVPVCNASPKHTRAATAETRSARATSTPSRAASLPVSCDHLALVLHHRLPQPRVRARGSPPRCRAACRPRS